ncbi:MAG: CAP domain-containing protein [Bacteroidia bacterium]
MNKGTLNILFFAFSILLFGFSSNPLPVGNDLKTAEKTFLIVNKYREKKGLNPLKNIPYMEELAREHSLKMARGVRAFGHRGWEERADLILDNIEVEMVAENVGFNKGYDDAANQILAGWIKSRTHKDNILNEEFDITGVGVSQADDGTVYFTQIFASYWEE